MKNNTIILRLALLILPLAFIAGIVLTRKGSLRGRLLLTGGLGYFLG